jgi:hypothetical protein
MECHEGGLMMFGSIAVCDWILDEFPDHDRFAEEVMK